MEHNTQRHVRLRGKLTTLLFTAVNSPLNFPPVGMPFDREHNMAMIIMLEYILDDPFKLKRVRLYFEL